MKSRPSPSRGNPQKWPNSRGKPDHVTDPLGNSIANTYDAANRVVRVTDPLGGSITNQYDANGNSIARFDKLGRRWSKTQDRLNRAESESDPLGNTRRTSYDAAGRTLQTTTPNGHPTLHAYDGRGRLTLWKDAEGFEWRYTYDGVGNITDIEDAIHGHYVMDYGPRNERTRERNQDNFEWRYEYDELLRLRQQRDPNGTTRTPTYDPAGRVLFVDFSTGRRDSFGPPDANDNLPLISRRFAGVTTSTRFVYDSLDRPIEQTDAHGLTVGYGYDPLGRVTALTYPGSRTLTNYYDGLGRLKRQVDWAGREMTYAYDLADRVVRRTWPNGVVQTNAFDTAGRLTALSHSTPNPQPSTISVALTYAYDRNGNKTGSSEKGTLRWPLPPLTDETSTFTPSGRLQTRRIVPSPGGDRPEAPAVTWAYTYDASGNLTNAMLTGGPAATSQSWALNYDEDNRTTSLAWTTNGVTHTVQNRYDALGRRVARVLDGATTGYVLSLMGGMERTLCDVTATGEITAWYVHGHDLSYCVDAANDVVCYHADAQANVIAMTGTSATNLVQYAYTPYGRVLGTTNYPASSVLSSQPYGFVGSQGVMEEFPGLYFMRARYYSADAGVFLSTDPVKKIGPAWKSAAYVYARANPYSYSDPSGNQSEFLGAQVAHAIVGFAARAIFEITGAFSVSVLDTIFDHTREEAIQKVQPGANFLINTAGADGLGGDAFEWLANRAFERSLNPVAAHRIDWSAIEDHHRRFLSSAQQQIRSVINASLMAGDGGRAGSSSSFVSAFNQGQRTTDQTKTPSAKPMPRPNSTSIGTGGSTGGTTSDGSSSQAKTYTVKAGDTAGDIGWANGVTANDIRLANPQIKDINRIYVDQEINIPPRSGKP